MKAMCISCFNYYDIRVHRIINFLNKKEYVVKYLTTDFNHFTKSRFNIDYENSKQIHVSKYKKNISFKRLVSHFQFSRKVANEIRKYSPDLIYCIVPPNSLVKEIAKYKISKNSKVKVIFDVYDMWPESFPYKNKGKIISLLFKLWSSLRDEYIRYADTIIAVSQKEKEYLDKRFSINTKVLLPNISITQLPNYSFNTVNEIVFLYLGNVNHITDIQLGTNLLSELVKYRTVTIHIIGEGQNRQQWVSMLQKAGVNVLCHGLVFDNEKKKNIFQNCQFGLNIPREEINSTMSLKSVEYMLFGLPFINSGKGDNAEIVENEKIGFNIDKNNYKEVINDILNLDTIELKEMHLREVNFYKNFFIEQDYNRLFEI